MLYSGDASDIADWLTTQFENHYNGQRTPLNLVLSAAWLLSTPGSMEGLTTFLDSLATKNDVFIVSHDKVVEWTKNPVAAGSYSSASPARDASCYTPTKTCPLLKGEEETRYMVVCTSTCPSVFPWLGNPLGQAQ